MRFFDLAFTSRGVAMIKFDSELKRYEASRRAYVAAFDDAKKAAADYPDISKVIAGPEAAAAVLASHEVGDPVFDMMHDGSKIDDALDLATAPSAAEYIVKFREANTGRPARRCRRGPTTRSTSRTTTCPSCANFRSRAASSPCWLPASQVGCYRVRSDVPCRR